MLKERIQEDMKAAMKGGDKRRLGAIRLILAAVKQKEVDERITVSDQDVMAVIGKLIKQRRDSAEQYRAAGRSELEQQELFEIEVCQSYLPEPLSDEELISSIEQAIRDLGATSMKDMGKVMAKLRDTVQGRADMGHASALIKQRLG
jgi:uncharacterized protein YqeY